MHWTYLGLGRGIAAETVVSGGLSDRLGGNGTKGGRPQSQGSGHDEGGMGSNIAVYGWSGEWKGLEGKMEKRKMMRKEEEKKERGGRGHYYK